MGQGTSPKGMPVSTPTSASGDFSTHASPFAEPFDLSVYIYVDKVGMEKYDSSQYSYGG